jgi:nitrite reductase/ring-hydroxylating ferredoxin subunit
MTRSSEKIIRAGTLDDLKKRCCIVVSGGGYDIAIFYHDGRVHAVDNRCPHMGFPLSQGSVHDGILTCHWHHARFDLASGGTFDRWAGDVRSFPVEIRNGEVWVDVTPHDDPLAHQRARLREGLEQDISLIIAKAAIALLTGGAGPAEPFRIGVEFGVRYRQAGWGPGLTILTCMMNLLPYLDAEDKPRALYHGLSAVARDCDGMAPRFGVQPLPMSMADPVTLKRWFRRFVEVRDADGAERSIVSAVRSGVNPQQIAEMLFAAATDHRYISIGHILDFTNKALENLDLAGWDQAESVLASLATAYANADRMEESSRWRHPVDLVAILEKAFEKLPTDLEQGLGRRGHWVGHDALVPVLLGEDAQAIADALVEALREGITEEELAGAVSYAAALRLARFSISNEFSDWDTALHTFTFANAVHQGLRRAPSIELLRGVFDAAMSVYLDRFLNMPPAPVPEGPQGHLDREALSDAFMMLLNRQQQVNEAAALVSGYLSKNGDSDRLLAALGKALLREDRDFHSIQMMEAAFRQYALLRGTPAGAHVLIAAARYLAAHAPTTRAQGQTYNIAWRLSRGERIYEG